MTQHGTPPSPTWQPQDTAHRWEPIHGMPMLKRCSRCGWGWKFDQDNDFPCPGPEGGEISWPASKATVEVDRMDLRLVLMCLAQALAYVQGQGKSMALVGGDGRVKDAYARLTKAVLAFTPRDETWRDAVERDVGLCSACEEEEGGE